MKPFPVQLARWSRGAGPREPAALEAARLCLVDTAACVLAGRRTEQCRRVAETVTRLRGEDSLGLHALATGTAAHALDFDDYEIPGSTHPSAVLAAALVALPNAAALRVADLLAAHVTGYEAIVGLGHRLGYSHYETGWHATSTLGTVGAAAASAFALGLDEQAFVHALALSVSSAAGLKANFGTDAKALHAGLAARAGLEAACLAAAGITANPAIVEAPYGFLALFKGPHSPMAGPALDGDRPPAILEYPPARKPWPCCAYTHRAIEAALELAPELRGRLDEVAGLALRLPEPFFRVSPHRAPRDDRQARFSVTYCVASALHDGELGPASFTPEALLRPRVAALEAAATVDAYHAADLCDMSPRHPDSVTVSLRDGSSRSASVAEVAGGPTRPLGVDDVTAKYLQCGGDRDRARAAFSAPREAPSAALLACFEPPAPAAAR